MKILIADDHALFRESLSLALVRLDKKEPEILQADNGNMALEIVKQHQDLNLILLDLDMPSMTGIEALRSIQNICANVPVVMISASDEHHCITQALELGAKGFIPKTTSTDVTLSALQLVLSGGTYLPPKLMPQLSIQQPNKESLLTPRQMEILCLLEKGIQNKNIAHQLDLSPSTVKVHMRRIFTALGAKNRSEAVHNAHEMGIL